MFSDLLQVLKYQALFRNTGCGSTDFFYVAFVEAWHRVSIDNIGIGNEYIVLVEVLSVPCICKKNMK